MLNEWRLPEMQTPQKVFMVTSLVRGDLRVRTSSETVTVEGPWVIC